MSTPSAATTGQSPSAESESGKSTVEQIRQRFDADVDRFSNLETGQSATIDASLVLSLITEAAAVVTPRASVVLDIGCGAGNYTLKLLERLPNLDCKLVDLSQPMLDRAVQRVSAITSGRVEAIQADVRTLDVPAASVDVVLAAAVLHHLRSESEWRAVLRLLYTALRPGGSIWIADLVRHDHPQLHEMMWRRYGSYLSALKGGGETGERYRDTVFAYIEQEDTPISAEAQLALLAEAGFASPTLLHKNSCFAAVGAVKP